VVTPIYHANLFVIYDYKSVDLGVTSPRGHFVGSRPPPTTALCATVVGRNENAKSPKKTSKNVVISEKLFQFHLFITFLHHVSLHFSQMAQHALHGIIELDV